MSHLWHPFADMGTVKDSEIVIARGEDVWVWDEDGHRYLDATASLWYAMVGHGRGEIAEAVAGQMSEIEAYSAFGDFASRPALTLAEKLAERAPMPCKIFLGSGGGDAIDTAAKLARRYFYEIGQQERTLLISRSEGYHGTHGFGTALAGIPANRAGFGPQAQSLQVPHDSLSALEQAVQREGPERIAAIFLEPVIGAGGVYAPAEGYIEGVAELCARTGIMLIADSVICGFGRLGNWFGIERWGVTPAMITFAKGVTSGYLPLGGVVIADWVAEPFWAQAGGPVFRHGPTYSAHATCCAAALANIEILERDGLITRGAENEGALHDALMPLAAHEAVAELRAGVGTLAALELSGEVLERDPGAVSQVVHGAREAGVLVRALARGIAVSPPLTATTEHFSTIADAVGQGLGALKRHLG